MNVKHILLVDDDDDIREVAGISLEAVGGWKVSHAAGGLEGISTALADHPDVILLDVMMPDIDGPNTYARLQADAETREIPVIFLTAKAQTADRQSFEKLGVTGILTKPFDPMQLSKQVEAILAREVPAA